jgi:hypothetical protein
MDCIKDNDEHFFVGVVSSKISRPHEMLFGLAHSCNGMHIHEKTTSMCS